MDSLYNDPLCPTPCPRFQPLGHPSANPHSKHILAGSLVRRPCKTQTTDTWRTAIQTSRATDVPVVWPYTHISHLRRPRKNRAQGRTSAAEFSMIYDCDDDGCLFQNQTNHFLKNCRISWTWPAFVSSWYPLLNLWLRHRRWPFSSCVWWIQRPTQSHRPFSFSSTC